MRVCFLSTYLPQRCGIATYTAELASALSSIESVEVSVISETGAMQGSDNAVDVWPTFTRAENYVEPIIRRARELCADAVHLQHSPDIWGMDDRVLRLVSGLGSAGMPTAVTLHTVHTAASGAVERRFGVAQFHRRLAEVAGRLVVHGSAIAEELGQQGVPAQAIQSIAHGTPRVDTMARGAARELLGLPKDAPVLLCFGFIHMQKNLHTVALAMKRLRARVPDAVLYLVGSLQNRAWYNRAYLQLLRILSSSSDPMPPIVLREDFVSPAELPCLYGAADLVLLPYAQGYGSASGIAHLALGARRIPVCSRSPKFAEIAACIAPELLVPTHSPAAWADALTRLLTDEPLRAELTRKVERYAEQTAWPVIAAQHLDLYRSMRVS
jgi:glycosyltransferase involved in cell wall biosynthesis